MWRPNYSFVSNNFLFSRTKKMVRTIAADAAKKCIWLLPTTWLSIFLEAILIFLFAHVFMYSVNDFIRNNRLDHWFYSRNWVLSIYWTIVLQISCLDDYVVLITQKLTCGKVLLTRYPAIGIRMVIMLFIIYKTRVQTDYRIFSVIQDFNDYFKSKPTAFSIYAQVYDVLFIVLLFSCTFVRAMWLLSFKHPHLVKYLSMFVLSVYALLILLVCSKLMGTLTLAHLHRSVLGDAIDICKNIDMKWMDNLSAGYVIPALFTTEIYANGRREKFHSRTWEHLGYVDRAENVLVVPAQCPSGKMPRIIIAYRPSYLLWYKKTLLNWETRILDRISYLQTDAVVRRNAKGNITSVELNSSAFIPQQRLPSTKEEATIRSRWKSKTNEVILIPLGDYNQYIVHCGKNEQEVFVHPLKEKERWEKADVECNTEEAPNGNVVVLFFDALSRYSASRRLKKFNAWLQNFQTNSHTGHRVEELPYIAAGHLTVYNWPLMTTGTSTDLFYQNRSNSNNIDAYIESTHVVFRSKKKYGERLFTTSSVDSCSDDYMTGTYYSNNDGPGFGRRRGAWDQYMYEPFCMHHDSNGLNTYFQSPVNEVYMEYLKSVVFMSLNESEKALSSSDGGCPHRSSFFHWFNFFDIHEPTEYGAELLDEPLTHFMEYLYRDLRFFDNPNNTVIILGDHGNHYGYYALHTDTGMAENGGPPLVFMIHPDTLNRMDKYKSRKNGTSLKNFMKQKSSITTPFDLFLTLCDIMRLNCPVNIAGNYTVQPRSIFDQNARRTNLTCPMLFGDSEYLTCGVRFCEPQ